MVWVKELVWDDWNEAHIARHDILPEEAEEICYGEHDTTETYRKRILLLGKTKKGKSVAVVLSPEDRKSQQYDDGIYYPITAFIKEKKQ